MKRGILVLAALFCFSVMAAAQAQDDKRHRAHVDSKSIPLPPIMQFVDRVLRPCASGVTPYVSAIAASDGDLDLTTCVGRSVTVNGVPLVIMPGGGLGDPGSNGYVVRTALNTTVARTFTTSGPVTVSNGNGVAGATVFGCTTCATSAAALTANQLVIGAGLQASATLGTLGTATTVLHGNAAGAPTFAAVALGSDVSGDLPFASFVPATAASRLLGRGSAAGAGDFEELTIGSGLSIAGTVLSATGGGTVTGTGTTNTLTLWSNGAGGVLADAPITASGNNIALVGELTAPLTVRTGNAANTDTAGLLTVGAGGTITFTFTQTYASAPVCVSSDTNAAPNITGASASTTVLTVTGTVGHVASYICVGRN